MKFQHYSKAVEFIKKSKLNFTAKYLAKKSDKSGLKILNSAINSAFRYPSSDEIQDVISHFEAKYLPLNKYQNNISLFEPYDVFMEPFNNEGLAKALEKVNPLLNTEGDWRSLFIAKGKKIYANTGNPSVILTTVKEKQNMAQELIDRLKMLKEINGHHEELNLILSEGKEPKEKENDGGKVSQAKDWLWDLIRDINSINPPTHEKILSRIQKDFPAFENLEDEPDLSFVKGHYTNGPLKLNKTKIDRVLTNLFNKKYDKTIKEGTIKSKFDSLNLW